MDLQEKMKLDLGTSCSLRYLFSESVCLLIFYVLRNKYFTVECTAKLLCISLYMKTLENHKTCVFDRILGSVIGLEKLG